MKNGLKFLEQLKENNNREWFANHKPEFDLIVKENKIFFNQIYDELQKHDSLNEIHVFRIYKDVRFSKDKSPYKTNLGAGYFRTKPHLRGGYYLQIEPNNSFVGGGFWSLNNEDLLCIRKEFEADTTEIEKITSISVVGVFTATSCESNQKLRIYLHLTSTQKIQILPSLAGRTTPSPWLSVLISQFASATCQAIFFITNL